MADIIQRSFSGGEVAPVLWARSDQTKYATGVRVCRNFIIHKYGGASNRPGTGFVDATKDITKKSRLIPFKYSISQTYAMEFGEGYIRLVRDGGYIVVTDSDAPAYNPVTAYVPGNLVTDTGVRYYCIANTTGNAPPNATYWHPFIGDIYEIPTPYTEADLVGIRVTQSADVVSLVHPSYDPKDLSRLGNVNWTLTNTQFTPSITAPTGTGAVAGVAGAIVWRYKVASVDAETGEESEPTAVFSCTGDYPTAAAPNVLTWTAVTGTLQYEVYKELVPGNGVYGLVGIAASTTFNDINIIPTSSEQPITNKTPFAATGDKPSVVAYYQGRRVYGSTTNDPETIIASKSGAFNNLSVSTPLKDDDAVTFALAGDSVNRIVGLVGLRKLVVLTEAGEWSIEGDTSGALTPWAINPAPQSYNGAADIHPIVIGNEILYVQARGNVIRSLGYEFTSDGYQGDDATLFAPHLFKGRTVVDWAYSQIPDSIVWVCMSDGALLGMTHVKSQKVWAWHRHDTNGGVVESVCVIPEGSEDVLYMIVRRTIDGAEQRYIERMHSRQIENVVTDAIFMDSSLSYDGTNADPSNTITLTGGTLWDNTESLTATSALSTFSAGSVGNAVVLEVGGVLCRLSIISYTSATEVGVRSVSNVPSAFQAVAIPDWSMAVDVVSGLSHLEGEVVSILADGNVVSDGVSEPLYTVSGGQVDVGRPYSIMHIGLPIESDIETLDIDGADHRTVLNKESLVAEVDLVVESSRGIWAGPDENNLTEYKQRTDEDYGELTALKTGVISVPITSTYGAGGRLFIRQRDPLPLSVLAVIPVGRLGGAL